jgi:thiosulfate/3-mercaptopyruvate sulfurtransferase
MSEYANPGALVDTEWLAEHLDDPKVRIVEVDEDTTAYEKGHIRNAVGWDWSTDLHDTLRREFVDQEGLAQLFQKAGVDDDTTVVLYGGNNNWFAAYAYWLFRYLGANRVKLLNGGRKKWELEGRELTREVPGFSPTGISIDGPVQEDLRAFRDEVLEKIGAARLVDVRSPEEYRGEKLAPDHLPQEQAQVPGHIPGAANVPWATAANEDGTFKSADELRQIYEEAGVLNGEEIIAYCRIGERSSHTWFALNELLGVERVKNYDGSWTEYGSLVGVPIER